MEPKLLSFCNQSMKESHVKQEYLNGTIGDRQFILLSMWLACRRPIKTCPSAPPIVEIFDSYTLSSIAWNYPDFQPQVSSKSFR